MSDAIKDILSLINTVESNTLQEYEENLCLSGGVLKFEEESPHKPPFAINFLEYYGCCETYTSKIIRHLFAYTYKDHNPFFESFARVFLRQIGFNTELIENPIVDKDHEFKGIDILVRDKQYAVIIENKLKGAVFQPNQLARYIATMRDLGYSDNQIFVVVLPKDDRAEENISESVWKLPPDWKSGNCRIDKSACHCDREDYLPTKDCSSCEFLGDIFHPRTMFLHKELSEWLYNCAANNLIGLPEDELRKQFVLTSAALQFVDFLNFLYQNRENNKFKMDIQKYLCEQLKLDNFLIDEQLSLLETKMSDVENLRSKLNELYDNKLKEYISFISKKYRVHLVSDDEWYFHYDFEIDGIRMSLILDYSNDEKKDFCQIETKNQKRKIPEIVRNDYDIAEELNDKGNRNDCIWRYDGYKESLLRFDRVLGRILELMRKD